MKKIVEYTIPLFDPVVKIPKDALILSVGNRYGELVVWALVDKEYRYCTT